MCNPHPLFRGTWQGFEKNHICKTPEKAFTFDYMRLKRMTRAISEKGGPQKLH